MFTADGTTVENGATVSLYKVRLYNSKGVAGYFVVDTELPAGGEYYDQVTNGVLWVALAEKAYAEANGTGWVTTSYKGSDSYNALNGGDPSWALQAITGKSANDFSINPTNIAAAWNAGQLIVLGSSPNANDNLIVGDSQGTHAYAVVSYIASSSTPFELYNPWGISADRWFHGDFQRASGLRWSVLRQCDLDFSGLCVSDYWNRHRSSNDRPSGHAGPEHRRCRCRYGCSHLHRYR